MIEQPGLFDEAEAVGPVNLAVIQAAVDNGYHVRTDPRTNLPFKDHCDEEFREEALWMGHRPGTEFDVEGFGNFAVLARWGEHKDEAECGTVIKDLNTTNEYMITYTYSSWDVPDDYKVVLAESYTFTETRWRKKR